MVGSSIKYRPDIDGLRAIAILLVIAFHAFPAFSPGGYVGVDIFFVISGFLISSTILRELEDGTFSLVSFYGRRFRRLMPALLLVLISTWVAGYIMLPGHDFIQLGKHIIAGSTFTSNILLKLEYGYFDSASNLKPLLHLWSLGVEEQFYLVWPIILIASFRKRWNISAITFLLFIASFGLNLALVTKHPTGTFYLLPTRFWELLIGCGLAVLQFRGKVDFSRPRGSTGNFMSALALTLVAVSEMYLNKNSVFPGWLAILPTLSAFLFIYSGPQAWFNRVVLSSRPAVLLGLISYPLYLWHWPLLSFARILTDNQRPTSTCLLVLILISGVLSYMTWKWVEKPVQKFFSFKTDRRLAKPEHVIAASVSLCGLLALTGLLSYHEVLIPLDRSRYPLAYAVEKNLSYDLSAIRIGRCFLDTTLPNQNFDPICTHLLPAKSSDLMLLGDSHASHYYPALNQLLSNSNVNLIQLTASSCPPLFFLDSRYPEGCRKVSDFVLSEVRRKRPSSVILSARWEAYYREKAFTSSLERTVQELRRAGVRNIIIVGPSPNWTEALPKLIGNHFLRAGLAIPVRTSIGLYKFNFTLEVNRILRDYCARAGLQFVSLTGQLCDVDGCLTRVGKDLSSDLIAYDDDHMTLAGAKYVVDSIIRPKLLDLGIIPPSTGNPLEDGH